MLKIDFD